MLWAACHLFFPQLSSLIFTHLWMAGKLKAKGRHIILSAGLCVLRLIVTLCRPVHLQLLHCSSPTPFLLVPSWPAPLISGPDEWSDRSVEKLTLIWTRQQQFVFSAWCSAKNCNKGYVLIHSLPPHPTQGLRSFIWKQTLGFIVLNIFSHKYTAFSSRVKDGTN